MSVDDDTRLDPSQREQRSKARSPWWPRRNGDSKDPERPAGERVRLPGGRRFWWILATLLVLNWFIVWQVSGEQERLEVPYSLFREQVEIGNVEEVTSRADTIQGTFLSPVTYPDTGDGIENDEFATTRPAFADDELLELLIEQDVVVNARPLDEPRSLFMTAVLSFGPTLLLVILFVILIRRVGSGGFSNLGRSKAKRYEHSTEERITFNDVAGIEEAEQELVEVVDFLKNPDKYRRLGGEIPRGVLLSGPPGTGKTLLARAVAGEADVPFFSLSASEFVEMIVGVGASRVRDLFKRAKELAPAIVFIDEIDAIGRARGGGSQLNAHDEREQTLNQILTEMDGFKGNEGVIILAATNRPEILDPALLRPGRFDRRVVVNPPDQSGRLKILQVHTTDVPLADDVDLATIASSTPGMVGADLKNLVNEAALLAARREHDGVEFADFTDALEKIILGTERSIMLSESDRRRTAYHEAGHALLGMLEPGADPVRKVSIVPRGRALGVTFQSPDSDRYGFSADYLRGRIIGALGGRAAEELVFGDVTTGAESDLEQVTSIARQMVGRWGMSEAIGHVSVLPDPRDVGILPSPNGASERTRELVDEEVRRITDSCYEKALDDLRANRNRLDDLADALLQRETLDEEEAYAVAGIARPEDPALTGENGHRDLGLQPPVS